ncbi:MAG: hypothetical protein C6W57_15045 [Caldibacillus debilis]|nr:MAG: hypothetical protein C6W57_15045 [Caldibacillus debilis]
MCRPSLFGLRPPPFIPQYGGFSYAAGGKANRLAPRSARRFTENPAEPNRGFPTACPVLSYSFGRENMRRDGLQNRPFPLY